MIAIISTGITSVAIVFIAVDAPICPGVTLTQYPALIPGDPTIPHKAPLQAANVTLLPTQYLGLFPGQLA